VTRRGRFERSSDAGGAPISAAREGGVKENPGPEPLTGLDSSGTILT
jgi:hypothetical protein